jgi:omega-amidase
MQLKTIIIQGLMKVIISLAQIELEMGNIFYNLQTVMEMVTEAHKQSSQLILIPELWSSGFDLQNRALYSKENANLVTTMIKLASENKIWIGGSWLEEMNGNFFNTFNLFSPFGLPPIKYAKTHLFRLMEEDKWLSAGNNIQLTDLPWGMTGLSVCYDLRFPELFRYYALHGASLILNVAEWPLRRITHWTTLLRARAIENQLFIAGVNSVGKAGDETFGGKSAIINPWGEALAEGDENSSALLTAEIDLNEVTRIRNWMPILNDRRPDIYG